MLKNNILLFVILSIMYLGYLHPVYSHQKLDKFDDNESISALNKEFNKKIDLENSVELKKSVIDLRKWVSDNSIVPVDNELIAYESTNLDSLLSIKNNNKVNEHILRRSSNHLTQTITSSFAYRIHPITGLMEHHNGIDLPLKEGSNIYAYDTGVIDKVSESVYSNAGKYISVLHDGEMKSLYMHLSKILVKTGQVVLKGELIGYSGSTGRTTGPHLHFEIRKNNLAVNPLLIGEAKWYIKSY